jgi:CDP-glucose 4,6-dehydratase
VRLASARAGNVIGGGDWALDRIVPDCIRSLQRGEVIPVRNRHATRPWQHVLEPLSGYLVLAQRLYMDGQRQAEAFNFGPQDEDARPVQWILERMVQRWGPQARWVHDISEQPHEANYLKLDISKAKARLGWQPRWRLAQALDHIVTWHRAWLEHADMRALCLQQITAYSATPTAVDAENTP